MNTLHATRSVVLIATRVTAHATAAGYDRLQDYLPGEVIRPPQNWSFAQRCVVRVLKRLVDRSGSQWYHRQNLLIELAAAKRWLTSSGRIFHFLYGENSYRYLGNLKQWNRRNAIVCTYHTPESRFAEVVRDRKHVAWVNAAIAVSTVQLDFLRQLVGPNRVHFVPHGIDVEFFKPRGAVAEDSENLECLFVGSHLRDLDTLAGVARRLNTHSRIRLTVITSTENAARFEGLRNVTLRTRVNDAELLDSYCRSQLFVFPLTDCTANNSLLEAMACGLPILSTDLQGVRDYVRPDCAVLVPRGAADEMADAVLELESSRGRLREMRTASRRRALEFRWEAVADMTRRVYAGMGL